MRKVVRSGKQQKATEQCDSEEQDFENPHQAGVVIRAENLPVEARRFTRQSRRKANVEEHERELPTGETRRFYAYTHEDRFIWGATAGMLRALYDRLYGAAVA